VIPALGAYYRPDRLEEALALLAAEPGARVLAGGTDLLLEAQPVGTLVDIGATHVVLETDDSEIMIPARLFAEEVCVRLGEDDRGSR
jgi:xanthine dehydrogenase iron-sulfur cluster and FAD-binding subunit A